MVESENLSPSSSRRKHEPFPMPIPTHDNRLPQSAVEKVTQRRGRRYAFETIDPIKTALCVIDVTNAFLKGTPTTASIIDPIDRIAGALREAGGTIAWVRPAPMDTNDPLLKALWGHQHHTNIADQTTGYENDLVEGLKPDPTDLHVQKNTYSAFFPGASPLPDLLAERGIDTVIITGVLTNICCESSARDAFTRGYKVIMPPDACAARTDAEHQAALYNVLRGFGDVRAVESLLTAVAEGSVARKT